MNQELTTIDGLRVIAPKTIAIAPAVGGALAVILSAHPNDEIDNATLVVWSDALSHFDAELLKFAALEVVNQVKWFPKLAEMSHTARMLQAIIDGKMSGFINRQGDDTARKRHYELREFLQKCSPATQRFIQAQREQQGRAALDARRMAA